jgi:hypothetical protein
MALMRSKLHLTDEELMNKSWIALKLEMADFPWFNPKASKEIKGEEANEYLEKLINK